VNTLRRQRVHFRFMIIDADAAVYSLDWQY